MKRISVDTVTCRSCGTVLKENVRVVTDDESIDVEPTPCSPTFAGAACMTCATRPPDLGLRYSPDACPVLWQRRHYVVGNVEVTPMSVIDLQEETAKHLQGWARGNLQHHLIHDHGVPFSVPYDGPLERIHADQHKEP